MGEFKSLDELGITGMDDFLEHHGIMGMKWGIRRYQPYPKGEGHKGKYISVGKSKKEAKRASQTARKESIADSKERSKSGQKVTIREANHKAKQAMKKAEIETRKKNAEYNKNLYKSRKAEKTKPAPKPEVKTLTDQELQKRLNRIRMEQQYNELTKPQMSKGQKKAKQILGTAATTVATTYTVKGMTSVIEKVIKKTK